MGSAKHHHFVPQFYLRRFSDDGRSIRLLNKASDRIIEGAPIKGQCAADNLHGWHQDVEQTLSLIESECAATIDRMVHTGELPARGSSDHLNLCVFVALQAGRTMDQAQANNALTDRFYKELARGRKEFADVKLDDYVIRDSYPVALPIVTALKAFHYLGSLDVALLSSGPKLGFLTSDNPVVLYNSLRADVWWEGVVGLDSVGLQAFLPLNRTHCLYLFDRAAYAKATNTGERRASFEDVVKLNVLAVLNSNLNLYGADRGDLEFVQSLRSLTKPVEDYERLAFVQTEEYEETDGRKASIIAHYRLQPPAAFQFRFAKIRRDGPCDGIRSDPVASSRRKEIPSKPGSVEVGIASSTLDGPRRLLNDNDVRQLAKRCA